MVSLGLLALLGCGARTESRLPMRPLRIGGGSGPPMANWVNQDKPTGFMFDVLNEAARRAGYALTWNHSSLPPNPNNQALRRGEIDLIAGISTPERVRDFYVSEPWWTLETVALMAEGSPIRSEGDLRGRRLAMTSSLVPLAPAAFPGAEIVERRFPAETVEPLCQGTVDAALIEEIYLREAFLGLPIPCRSLSLRVVDTTAHVDYVLIAPRGRAQAARALRAALDDLTADGTLAALAARYPAISMHAAERLAATLQVRYQNRTLAIAVAGACLIVLLGVGVTVALSRSRLRLRTAYARLKVDLEARIKAEADRAALQEQLLQSQKLDSVGQLAGGVAHDFNNLLTVMRGYAQMALVGLSPSDERYDPLVEIARAGDRAAALTRQLLMFSRRQAGAPRIVSLNALVGNVEKLLRRLIGEDIEILFVLDPAAGAVRADPVHIEQMVLNLAINARDAMPEGGRLVVETVSFRADAAYAARHAGIQPGDYAVLKVSDSGCGMTPEVKARIFEPFFTTKEQGKGTGLGLSTVYGIVKQCGGAISVYSEAGHGSVFKILLPAAKMVSAETSPTGAAERLSGSETILLAEDDPEVRKFIRDLLSSEGYRILEADNGRSALQAALAETGPIHLLVSDLVMPEMGGADLARRFAELYPSVPVLLMSGYSDRAMRPGLPGIAIEKPFTPDVLLRVVRQTLDKRFAGPAAAS